MSISRSGLRLRVPKKPADNVKAYAAADEVAGVGVPEIVDTWTPGVAVIKASFTYQCQESLVDVLVERARAALGEKEAGTSRLPDVPVSHPSVSLQRVARRLVKDDLTRLAKLAVSDDEQRFLPIDVRAFEGNRLADPHPGYRQQAEQRGVGGCPQWALEPLCGLKQRGDLGNALPTTLFV